MAKHEPGCGCTVVLGGGLLNSWVAPKLCPLHGSAPELADALRFLLREYSQHVPDGEGARCPDVRAAADRARAVLRLSEGRA